MTKNKYAGFTSTAPSVSYSCCNIIKAKIRHYLMTKPTRSSLQTLISGCCCCGWPAEAAQRRRAGATEWGLCQSSRAEVWVEMSLLWGHVPFEGISSCRCGSERERQTSSAVLFVYWFTAVTGHRKLMKTKADAPHLVLTPQRLKKCWFSDTQRAVSRNKRAYIRQDFGIKRI